VEKVLDYLYDFIGIFIPGVTFWLFLWLTTGLLLPMDSLQALVNKLPNKPMLLADTSYPFVQAIVSREALVLVLVIIVCYITGIIFSEKQKFGSKDQQNEQEFIDVYNENKKLVAFIDEELHSQMKVDWTYVVGKNKWIVYYRWANMLSPNSSDKLNLQLMLAKTILHRSLMGVFRLLGWLVLIPVLIAFGGDVLRSNITLSNSAYYLVVGGCAFLAYKCLLSIFFSKTSERHRKLLHNESILVLSKYYLAKKET
jgi:hypothetical protein